MTSGLDMGWVDFDLGSSRGWWDAIRALELPTAQEGWWNIPYRSQPNPMSRPDEQSCRERGIYLSGLLLLYPFLFAANLFGSGRKEEEEGWKKQSADLRWACRKLGRRSGDFAQVHPGEVMR